MNTNSLNKLTKSIGSAVKNIDFSKVANGLARAGKEIGRGLSQINWGKAAGRGAVYTMAAASVYALGALSRQPEINKVKGENQRVMKENERLRYAVKRLNHSVEVLHKKIEALKAYQFTEKAKETEELKGCIMYQYATKEYLEKAIKKASDEGLTADDKKYMDVFEQILNDEYDEEDSKYITSFIMPKYKEKIESYIEFDCLPLIERLRA